MFARDKIVIAPEWQSLLRANRWDNVEGVYAFSGGTVLKCGAATELRRVELPEAERSCVLFVKKYCYLTSRLRWSGFYRGTFLGISKVRCEFENLARLRQWGLNAPAAVAYGEERRGRWLHRSFLISEGVPNPLPLDLFIRDYLPSLERDEQRRLQREMIERLADYTRRMHEHRFVHHDYFWRNILLSGGALAHFYLVDSHKGRCWKPWMEKRSRAKDLATLDAPAPLFFRRSERLRFFLRYRCGSKLKQADKKLIRLVLRLAESMRKEQQHRVQQARAHPEPAKGIA
jgi:tRNA A-37 threonylcarbamoyl transferase component Bud32